ncbi:MAG TPA: DUF3568 family protein [Longimicrobiaceae bacterium]|nr:DUF3568 family protein [Longimicrobiaceae bacterium]
MTRLGTIRIRAVLFAAAVALLATGCMAAAVAGAGAAAGIHMTGNNASSTVQGTLASVDARTQAVLSEMGIAVEERKEGADGVEYSGTGNGMEVHVELEPAGDGMTQVKASARKNPVEWDNAYARDIVQRIVQRS